MKNELRTKDDIFEVIWMRDNLNQLNKGWLCLVSMAALIGLTRQEICQLVELITGQERKLIFFHSTEQKGWFGVFTICTPYLKNNI